MNKPDDIPQDVWEIATGIEVMDESVCDWDYNLAIDISKAIIAAKAEERERIKELLAHGAPHSPRRYIYDVTPDRRIWACDKLDESIDS